MRTNDLNFLSILIGFCKSFESSVDFKKALKSIELLNFHYERYGQLEVKCCCRRVHFEQTFPRNICFHITAVTV